MTGFRACLTEAHAAGEIDAGSHEIASEAYDEAYAAQVDALGPVEADRRAATSALSALEAADLRKRQLRTLAIRTRRDALANLAAFKRRRGYAGVKDYGAGGKPPKGGWVQGGEPPKDGPYSGGKAAGDFLIELVDGQGGLAGAAGPSIKGRYQALRGSFDAMMADLFEAFETKIGFDAPGRVRLEALVRETFGEDSGDAIARGMAKSWDQTSDYARQLFNAAGGDIGKLEAWGLPQSHDSLAVRDAGQAAWVDETLPLLDRARMVDRATGQPFTEKRLKVVLGEVHETIATEGASAAEPGEFLGRGAMANRRGEERFLIFKNADAWMAYQAKYGKADPYAAMVNHLDRMARDIAQMQVLGPNPEHQFAWLQRFAVREAQIEEAAGARRAGENARSAIDTATRMYGHFTGELAGAYGRENRLAFVTGAVRAGLAGVQLGSAVINDLVSNPVFAAKTRAFTGLSKTGDFQAWAAHALSPEMRKTARRTGFILDGARTQLAASAQDLARATTVGGKMVKGLNWASRRMPAFVFRASLLTQNLAASRWAFQHELMGALADRRGRSIADLLASRSAEDRELGGLLRARGIGEDDWGKLASIDLDTPAPGASFLSPAAIRKAGHEELSWAWAEMIERQVRLAVPEPSLWAQSHLVGHARPGTIVGEVMRSLTAYRSFTVTQTYLWSREMAARGMAKNPVSWAPMAASHAASLIIPLTLAGALNIQLREIAKGNDPRDWRDPTFWGAALLQGGGLGIFGDFLYASRARNGKSSALTAMGSPAAFASDAWNLTAGNALDIGGAMLDPDDPASLTDAVDKARPGRDLATFLARYSPVSSLWWARAAWSHGVVDQLQKILDPDADDAFRRRKKTLERETGQGQWWPTGEALPERAPDIVADKG